MSRRATDFAYYSHYCEVGFTFRMLGCHIISFTREGNTNDQLKIRD